MRDGLTLSLPGNGRSGVIDSSGMLRASEVIYIDRV
jgi:hypothetical protein